MERMSYPRFLARAAMTLLVALLGSATGAWAQDEETIYAGFTATNGTQNNSEEGYAKLVDGKFTVGQKGTDWTKWGTSYDIMGSPSGETGSYYWVDFYSAEPINVASYILTTGNDNNDSGCHDRNPKSWVLKAKANENDDSWTTIATVSNDQTMADEIFTNYRFALDVPGIYKYFRFMISETRGATFMQLCELRFSTLEIVNAPSGLAATLTPGNGTIATLSWTQSGIFNKWQLQYGTASDFVEAAQVEVTGTPTKALTGLTPETTYYARVRAVNSNNVESDWSNTVTFTPSNVYSVTVGNGTSTTSYAPLFGSYKSSYAQMIYTASQLQAAGISGPCLFNKLGFNSKEANRYARRPVIYLCHAPNDKSSFSSNTDFVSINEFTKVYDYADHSEWSITAGWNEFELDTPFEYDGKSNLIVAVHCSLIDSWSATSFYSTDTNKNQVVLAYKDDPDPDPATYEDNWSNYSGNKDISTNLPNLKLYFDPVTGDCAFPANLAVNNITKTSADVSWTSDATTWQICLSGNEDNPTTVSENSYELNDLTPNTSYTVKVRTVCSEGSYSAWISKTFTTLVACPVPTGLDVTADGQDAIFTWTSGASEWDVYYTTEQGKPGDQADLIKVTDNTSYTVNNLNLDTDYNFWVRANCGGADGHSLWVGPATVHIGYCVPNPSSRDGKGITKVSFGIGDNIVNNVDETNGLPATSPYYGNYSSMVGAVQAGVESTISITYATLTSSGTTVYSYGTIIWVDWDNSLSFEDSEIVYTGTSAQGSGGAPQVLEASFTVPANQPTGDYRMRIAGADSYFDSYIGGNSSANHSACFSSSYAVCHDYTLRVLKAPSCFPPTELTVSYTGGTTATAEVSWTSDATAWNIDVNGTVTAVTKNPYTLTGLDLGTTYTVKVQAICGGDDGESEWSKPISFTTDLCLPEDQCVITFELTDSYGDGWNGAYIEVVDVETGAILGQMANENLNGSSNENEVNIKTLAVCIGREIQFVWRSGSYDSECSFIIKDINEDEIVSGSGNSSALPFNYTVNSTSCRKPTNLAVNYEGGLTATVTWEGMADTYNICVNDTETKGVTSPYTLNDLKPATTYEVKVQADCGNNDTSNWTNPISFTTLDPSATPSDLAVSEISALGANLSWTGNQQAYNLRYRQNESTGPTAPATIVLNYPEDNWGDGSGYQMLLDADATAYGTIIPAEGGLTTDGDASAETYNAFEYKIPGAADGSLSTENIVTAGKSVNIEIPAGTYDWCITNPTPGDRMWIAASNGNVGGRYDDFVFEPGLTYRFTVKKFDNYDGVDVSITSPSMGDWTVAKNVTSPYQLKGLTPCTYYEWQVQGVCSECDGGVTEWSNTADFFTKDRLDLANDDSEKPNGEKNAYLIDVSVGKIMKVALVDRTLYTDGYWNTLCVPFSLDNSQIAASPLAGATIMELATDQSSLNDEGVLTLNFTEVSSIMAGTPYIIKWSVPTANFTCSAISGSSGYDNQNYAKLIDGDKTTKWCASLDHHEDNRWVCEFSTSCAVNVTGYTLTTGNDTQSGNGGNGYEDRNPKVWTLEAKVNSDDDWITIDSRNVDSVPEDALPVADLADKTYTIAADKQGTYWYFRFVVSSTGGNDMQLSELKLLGSANVDNPVFTNVLVSSVKHPATIEVGETKSVVFKGTYDYMSFTSDNRHILLLGDEDTLYWPLSGASIGACRAYFQLNGITAGDIAATRLFFGNGEVQGITVTGYTDSADKGGAWYTINGMKLDKQPTRKGLYIRNGRKVVKK